MQQSSVAVWSTNCFVALHVYERTCDIFSYALASFLHLCQSSQGTRITEKNVSHDNHVNKDNSGNNYTKMSSFNGCYIWELVCGIHQAATPSKAKMKKTAFILRFHAFNGNECVILYHFIKWGLDSNNNEHGPLKDD